MPLETETRNVETETTALETETKTETRAFETETETIKKWSRDVSRPRPVSRQCFNIPANSD